MSDQQRERAAQELREHFAAGRITEDELDERVQAAYSARTQEGLSRLVADLPQLPVTRQQLKAENAERRSHLQRRLLQETGGSFGVFVLCAAIWVASGANGPFWPIWVAIFPVVALLRNAWMLYGPAPQLDEVERQLQRRRHHHDRHRRRRDRRL